jgi:hypothetical protein
MVLFRCNAWWKSSVSQVGSASLRYAFDPPARPLITE